jgi:hypothetical protein
MEMLYGIVTVFRDMRFLIDDCFHLSAPKVSAITRTSHSDTR